MDLEKAFQRTKVMTLSSKERQKASILILDPETNVRQTIRQSLVGLGYGLISDAGEQSQALQKIEDKDFTHIIFDARGSRIPPKAFLKRAFELKPEIIAIASSYEPTVDDVFDLLISGAKGYLVKPITTQSLDDSIVYSSKGEPVSEAVLTAKNRNEALAALAMASLDKLAIIMKQARHFDTAKREIPGRIAAFKHALELGHTFAKGGSMMLRESLVNLLIERSQAPASRVPRFKRRQMEKEARQT